MFFRGILLALCSTVVSGKLCKCLHGDRCWPNEGQFSQLETKLSTPLIYPVPPASVCYDASGNCTEFQLNSADGRWRSDQPGSMQAIQYESYIFKNGTIEACYSDPGLGLPCGQGSVSPIGVDARTPADVQETVKFVAKHNVRLVIKNTGHDYLSRSAARGSLLLWTHHLKNITYNPSFVPAGGPHSKTYDTLTLGAGVQWFEAYAAAEQYGKFIVGGVSARGSVGATGGWLAGGGHSPLSPVYGLGVDNVLELTVVTADGKLLVTNAHRHSDLFWALRGGGGGTYGVVLSATYRVHAPVSFIASICGALFPTPEIALDAITEFIKLTAVLESEGWGGYAFFNASGLQLTYVAPNRTYEEAAATITPFFDHLRNLTGDIETYLFPTDFPTWFRSFFSEPGQVGSRSGLVSRFVTRKSIKEKPTEIAETLLSFPVVEWNQVGGGAVGKFDPDSTGLNPAWRKALSNVLTFGSWPEGASSSEIEQVQAGLRKNLATLEALDPGAGTYFNEASPHELDPKGTFFGSHYARLAAIKHKYDPQDIFIVYQGVGSAKWDKDLHCRIN